MLSQVRRTDIVRSLAPFCKQLGSKRRCFRLMCGCVSKVEMLRTTLKKQMHHRLTASYCRVEHASTTYNINKECAMILQGCNSQTSIQNLQRLEV